MRFRECCGTLRGMLAHQAAGEEPCGWCELAERAAHLTAEATRPSPPEASRFAPVTADEASVNAAVLSAEVEKWEKAHPEGIRNLRSVA